MADTDAALDETQTGAGGDLAVDPRRLYLADLEFPWSEASIRAAIALAGISVPPGYSTPVRVARMVGVTVTQIKQWQAMPAFAQKVNALTREAETRLVEEGLAIKAARVNELRKRHALLLEITERREEWAAENAPDDTIVEPSGDVVAIPGLGTGWIALKRKSLGSGDSQRVIVEGEIDLALAGELRRIEEQIARELGQLNPEAAVNVNVKLYAGINLDAV